MTSKALSAFLGRGKNKRITAHQHVCSALGLDTKGKAPVVKQRIITFVGEDKEKDSKVRDLVTKYIENAENDGKDGESTSQSQDMFSHDSYRTSSVSESITDSDDENEGDENEEDKDEDDKTSKEKTSATTVAYQPVPNTIGDIICQTFGKNPVMDWKGRRV